MTSQISSQSHVQLLSPLLPSEDSPMVNVQPSTQAKLIRRYETDGVTNEMAPLYAANMSGNSGSAQRTELDINTLNISSSGSWSDVQVWPYSTVRVFWLCIFFGEKGRRRKLQTIKGRSVIGGSVLFLFFFLPVSSFIIDIVFPCHPGLVFERYLSTCLIYLLLKINFTYRTDYHPHGGYW